MPSKRSKPTLIMISAMYENGGNTTHRLLDGHPDLYVYPFESQIGTKYGADYLSSVFPAKYRWPIVPNSLTAEQIYEAIIDEEFKVRVKTPHVSKFRDKILEATDAKRKEAFVAFLKKKPLTRRAIVEAFYYATFATWKNVHNKGKGSTYVGYSPIIGVDGEQIIRDFGDEGVVLHVVRNPFSAYADTKKRPVPLSLEHYMYGWVTCQYYARLYAQMFPRSFMIVRFEDIIKDPQKTLGDILKKVGLSTSKTLMSPTWNGEPMEQVYPWGTIRTPKPKANLATARELSQSEIEMIYFRTQDYLQHFKYTSFYRQIKNV